MASLAFHVLVVYAALTSHWHYKIFSYREKPRQVFLAARDLARYAAPKAQPGRPARPAPAKAPAGGTVAEPGAKPSPAAKERPV